MSELNDAPSETEPASDKGPAMRPNDDTLLGGVERREIRIAAYDARWPDRFAALAQQIGAALGEAALRVEHVGSTAVPGLAAKPIIDLLLVVADSSDEASYVPALVRVGYELRVREPDFEQHRMLRTIGRDAHVHVYSPGASEIDRLIAFRDRLRTDDTARRLYEKTKRRLARREWPDMNAYAEAKTPVIRRILRDDSLA